MKIFYCFFILLITTLLTGCNDVKMIDFKNLPETNKPNTYLVCRLNFCNLQPDLEAAIYPLNVKELQSAWLNMIDEQPRTKLVASDPTNYKFQYVQYSRVFRFPDYIDVQFIPIDENKSTLAIFSRARFGYYDFHVNQKRIKTWLQLLPNYFTKIQ